MFDVTPVPRSPEEQEGGNRWEALPPGLVWVQSAVLSDAPAAAAVGEGLPGGDRCRRRTSGRGLGIAASRVSGAGRMGPRTHHVEDGHG